MLVRDSWPWTGRFVLTLENRLTGAIRVVEVPNLITDAGLNWLRDRMQGRSDDYLTDLAVGTDGRAAQPTDAALFGEVSRKAVVLSQPETGVSLADAFWDHTEANVHIREVGVYAGTILVARAVVDVPKSNQESLTVTRRDTLARASTGG